MLYIHERGVEQVNICATCNVTAPWPSEVWEMWQMLARGTNFTLRCKWAVVYNDVLLDAIWFVAYVLHECSGNRTHCVHVVMTLRAAHVTAEVCLLRKKGGECEVDVSASTLEVMELERRSENQSIAFVSSGLEVERVEEQMARPPFFQVWDRKYEQGGRWEVVMVIYIQTLGDYFCKMQYCIILCKWEPGTCRFLLQPIIFVYGWCSQRHVFESSIFTQNKYVHTILCNLDSLFHWHDTYVGDRH